MNRGGASVHLIIEGNGAVKGFVFALLALLFVALAGLEVIAQSVPATAPTEEGRSSTAP